MRNKNSSAWWSAENHHGPLDGADLQHTFKKEGKLEGLPQGEAGEGSR